MLFGIDTSHAIYAYQLEPKNQTFIVLAFIAPAV